MRPLWMEEYLRDAHTGRHEAQEVALVSQRQEEQFGPGEASVKGKRHG